MEHKNTKIEKISISDTSTILEALKCMDKTYKRLLLVFKDNVFLSLLSIGDIQRAIINGVNLDTSISKILRDNIRLAKKENTFDEIKALMLKWRAECMPIVDSDGNLIDVYFWEDVFGEEEKIQKANLELPVVIMAGGKGTRMRPLTNVIPKPLIPIGKNTIIEEIMNRFVEVGCNDFQISVNYKAETIKHYFKELNNKHYKLGYFQEEKPLGTAGSLFLIKDKITTTFFVSNCDIIIDEDYSEILKYHQENKNELTIVSALKHYPIAYGTIETSNGGVLTKLIEKPDLTFQINTGMYILEPHLLKEIPENTFFHITHLIENIQKRKGKVGVFPISEGSWKDIGEWDEYLELVQKLK